MKITSKLNIMTLLSSLSMITAALAIGYSLWTINTAMKTEQLADRLESGVLHLNILTNEYMHHPGERSETQWHQKYAAVGSLLNTIVFTGPEEKSLLARLDLSHRNIKNIFIKLKGLQESKGAFPEEYKERLRGQMAYVAYAMVSDITKINTAVNKSISAYYWRAFYLIIGLLIFTALANTAIVAYLGRDIVNPVVRLQRAAEVVSSGDLNNRTGIVRDDEIGQLSKAFDDMTGRLKATYTRLENDITERKKAEDELSLTNRTLSAFINNIPDLAWIKDKEGRFVIVNEAFSQACGAPIDQLPGKTDLDIWPRELADKYIADDRNVMKIGQQQQIVEQYVDAEGQSHFVETIKTPFKNDRDTVIGTVGIARDISERKKAEERIKQHEDMLSRLLDLHRRRNSTEKEIFDFMLDAIQHVGLSKFAFIGIMSADESTMVIHAWSRETMKECAVAEKPIHYPVEKAGLWGETIRQRRPYIVNDYELIAGVKKGYPEGHVPIKRFLGIPVFSSGRIVAVGVAANKASEYNESDINVLTSLLNEMWNIIESKKKEDQISASLREKEVLLREIHHRVKNNMTIIYSLLDLQSKHTTELHDREMFDDAKARIKTMALIHEKLYKSKDMARIDFSNYLRDILDNMFMSYVKDPGRIALNADVKGVALGIDDAIPCGLIINELLSNTLKHAFPEGRRGEVRVSMRSYDNDMVELIVSDNGVGLPNDLDIRKKASLGLNLIDGLVKQLQGELELRKEEGTQFRITFRRRK